MFAFQGFVLDLFRAKWALFQMCAPAPRRLAFAATGARLEASRLVCTLFKRLQVIPMPPRKDGRRFAL